MICAELTSEGYVKQAPPETCSYVLLSVQEHTKLTDISSWFQLDVTQIGIAFSSGIVIWALGLKLGAIARIIVGAKRG